MQFGWKDRVIAGLIYPLVVILGFLIGCKPLQAQAVPAIHHMRIAPEASRFLDSLANDVITYGHEVAGCLADYSVGNDTLKISRFIGARYGKADTLSIDWLPNPADSTKTIEMCPHGMPSIHTHWLAYGLAPASGTDRASQMKEGTWDMILEIRENGWLVKLYGTTTWRY